MRTKIVSALMSMAICASALPMAVYAENDTTTELPEFTQKFCDEYLLKPEESEENRLIYNFAKRMHDDYVEYNAQYGRIYDTTFLGIQKDGNGIYRIYKLSHLDPEDNFADSHKNSRLIDSSGFINLKIAQAISQNENISFLFYINNLYITEEDFNKLSYDEKIITAEKIYEETGEDIVDAGSTSLACSSLYIDTDGKGHNWNGKEIDIVDGEVVTIPTVTPDNVDVLTNEILKGDANEDGEVNSADAVYIMQCLSNPDDYQLTEQGLINADYNGDGGVTASDALEIQILMIS